MLLDKYHRFALPIADSLSNSSMTLSVVPGSPLSKLMESTVDFHHNDITSSKDVVGVNRHDIVMDATIKLGVSTIRSSMYRARNVVLPIVKELFEDVTKEATAAAIDSMEYTITPKGLPSVYAVPALAEVLRNFKSTLPIDTEIPADLIPTFNSEELDRLGKINISSIDSKMAELYSAEPNLRSTVIASLFTRWIIREMNTDSEMIATFVLARGLLASIDSWDESGSSGLRAHLAGVGAVMGTRVKAIIAKRDAAVRRKAIVTGVNGKVITVNADTYNEFLEKGGNADIVIGSVLAGEGTGVASVLLDKADVYTAEYSKYVNISSGNIAKTKRDMMLRLITRDMLKLIKTDEVFKEKASEYTNAYNEAKKRIVLNSNDPYPYILNIVCTTFFADSDVLAILTGIDSITNEDESISPREAATIVMHGMVNDWLLSMVAVERAKR